MTRAFVVTDPVLADNGTAARITDLLDAAGITWEIFSDVAPNPPVEKVQAGLAAFRASGAEILIGLGGGSPQDTCKAISVIAANPEFEDVLSLEGLSPTKNPGGARHRRAHHRRDRVGDHDQLRHHRHGE